jgi:mannose-6-phosphate isomerase-like protein (cupin superfamily)
MKEASGGGPYALELMPGQAVVTEPWTLFQLRNDGQQAAEVLYIASPSYVFEMDGDAVRYDDAVLVARTWEEAAAGNYEIPELRLGDYEVHARREEAKRRLAIWRSGAPKALAGEGVVPLKSEYDYLAPDESEIRLLVGGEHGGLAHCVLPAGKLSGPVHHRTVEELWYVLEGAGEIRRGRNGEPERRDALRAGDSVRIPVGVTFQFRASAGSDLKLLLSTMPAWPGTAEAVPEPGRFEDPVSGGRR